MKTIILYLAFVVISTLNFGCSSSIKPQNNSKEFSGVTAMIENAKNRISEIEIEEFKKLIEQEEYFILIDVRTEKEHNTGYIPGSVLLPRGLIEFRIANEGFWDDEGMYLPEKTDQLIIYCKSGNRSALATDVLQSLGYKNVLSLKGGWNAWKEAFPDMIEKNETPSLFTPSNHEGDSDDASC